jgi:hypothetical protein
MLVGHHIVEHTDLLVELTTTSYRRIWVSTYRHPTPFEGRNPQRREGRLLWMHLTFDLMTTSKERDDEAGVPEASTETEHGEPGQPRWAKPKLEDQESRPR